ncbi:MAG: hypothetical protein K6F05_02280, partial [Succinivibrio sp.]|nr:hypothetical protein [Succinivibrio sp.]
NPTEVSYLPTTSADGKVSSVFDHNIVSVEAELGKLLTQVNNFSMAKNSNPTMVVNDILQPQGGKPIVEVTQNPGGHGSSAA